MIGQNSVYEIMQNFAALLLGETAAATAQGQIFTMYAAYIMVAVILVGTFKVLKYFINAFRF